MAGKRPPFDIRNICMAVFYLVPSSRVRESLPEPLKVVEVLPGMTIGGIYAARYAAEKECAGEFGVLESYASHGGKRGFFMRHILLDSEPASDGCGGADFSWRIEKNVVALEVASGGSLVAGLKMRPILGGLNLNTNFPFFCLKSGNVVFFQNHFIKKVGLSSTKVTIPEGSPLKGYPFGLKVLSAYWDTANIIIREPEYVPKRAIKAHELGIPIGKST